MEKVALLCILMAVISLMAEWSSPALKRQAGKLRSDAR
jgi:hypothetical protein